jgi:hypothetical protein
MILRPESGCSVRKKREKNKNIGMNENLRRRMVREPNNVTDFYL